MQHRMWRAELLGKVLLRSGEEVAHPFRERKVGVLLAMLALQERSRLTREQILEFLWPEESPELSRNRLRVTLHRLRRILEPPEVVPGSILKADRATILISPAVLTSDVVDFITALNEAQGLLEPSERRPHLERALSLYGGEFLPGYDSEWVIREREHLAHRHFQALRRLTRDLFVLGSLEQGAALALQAVALEPLNEEARFDLIRIYAGMGEISQALRHYEAYREMLAEEMGAKPAAVTQKLASLLMAKQAQSAPEISHSVITPGIDTLSSEIRGVNESAALVRTRLPSRMTRFFGREEEIDSLRALLSPDQQTRFVTLLGPGGVGKTRTALETAERMKELYHDRVFFTALADVSVPLQLGDALLTALGLPASGKLEAFSQVVAALVEAPALLILDNLEQLLPAIGTQLNHLVEEVPSLRILVTSRRNVGIEAEWEYAISPFLIHDKDLWLESLRQSPAIALFLDRARASRSEFTLTESNAEDVVWICRQLEGLPLAIELAAARVRTMNVREMRTMLEVGYGWFMDAPGRKVGRHHSLRAAIEWSYDLLSPSHQRCFEALSVFAGGFTQEAAAQVCADLFSSSAEVILTLEGLSSDSLLTVREDSDGRMRLAMLETLRAFGLEKLEKNGQEHVIRNRHLVWCAGHVESETGKNINRSTLFNNEMANLRAALDYGLRDEASTEEKIFASRMAVRLPEHWLTHGMLEEGKSYLRRILSLSAVKDVHAIACAGASSLAIRQGEYEEAAEFAIQGLDCAEHNQDKGSLAGCLVNLGKVSFHQGDYPSAQARFDEALSLCERLESPLMLAECLIQLGLVAWYQAGHEKARKYVERALEIYRGQESEGGKADCLLWLGNIVRDKGDLAAGEALFLEALPIYNALQDRHGIAKTYHDLGFIAIYQGEYQTAQIRFDEALIRFREIGERHGSAATLRNMAELNMQQEKYEEAHVLLMEALHIYRKMGERRGIAFTLHNLSTIEQQFGRIEEALTLINEALLIDEEIGNPAGVAQRLRQIASLYLQRAELTLAEAPLITALSIQNKIGNLSEVALTLEQFVAFFQKSNETNKAIRFAGLASMLLCRQQTPPSPAERRFLDPILHDLREKAGSETFEMLWREGEQQTLEEAVNEIKSRLE